MTTNTAVSAPPAKRSLFVRLFYPGPTQNRVVEGPARKGGRNVPAAVGVAVLLIGLVALSLIFNKVYFALLVAVAICVALWELAGAFARRAVGLPLLPLWVGTFGAVACAYVIGPEGLLAAVFATSGACMVWSFTTQAQYDYGTALEIAHPEDPRTYAHDVVRRSRTLEAAAAIFSVCYLPFLAGFAVMLLAQNQGVGKIVTLIALPALSDTGGWLAGITFGKHPMAPKISPKKTWEGFVGSVIATTIGTGVVLWLLGGTLWATPLLALAVVISATLGDLGESLIKRDLGLKDMSNLLPGHGGLLDRIDSILTTAPVLYIASVLAL